MQETRMQTNPKPQIPSRSFDLEDRTTVFAKSVIKLCREVSPSPLTDRIVSQLVGSAGSVGANYREANDALGKRDFSHRLRIARKESKETLHWLALLKEAQPSLDVTCLQREAQELRSILSAIILKSSRPES